MKRQPGKRLGPIPDPDHLDRRALDKLIAFAHATDPADVQGLADSLQANPRLCVFSGPDSAMGIPKLLPDALENAQRLLRQWFDILTGGADGTCELPLTGSEFQWLHLSYKDGVVSRNWFLSGPVAFWLGMSEVMLRAGAAVRRCPTCQSLFVKRKGQKFCAPPKKCSQQTRSAKWYAANKRQVLRRRHLSYVAQVKKLQPKAVVKRRPRLTFSSPRGTK